MQPNFNTVFGAVFDHQGENSCLGTEISIEWFQKPFFGKTIFKDSTEFVSIKVLKVGVKKYDTIAVDAFSGGTISSNVFEAMLDFCRAQFLRIFLPLIAVNCAILAGSLFMEQPEYKNIGKVLSWGLDSGVGWALEIISLAAVREKLKYNKIPAPLMGIGITFIITGLMEIAFMSFLGIKV